MFMEQQCKKVVISDGASEPVNTHVQPRASSMGVVGEVLFQWGNSSFHWLVELTSGRQLRHRAAEEEFW